jgi:hypothetical protein
VIDNTRVVVYKQVLRWVPMRPALYVGDVRQVDFSPLTQEGCHPCEGAEGADEHGREDGERPVAARRVFVELRLVARLV